MARFVHVYHLLCGHTREEEMTPFERAKWENEGYSERTLEHQDQKHRCSDCEDRYQREKGWREVLEGEYALGLSPLSGDRVARYVRLREVQRIQQFWCHHPWFSPQTNERVFQMYLDYIRLFSDAQSWLRHWRPEAQWKSKEFLADQQLRIQFQGTLPPEERRIYEVRCLQQPDALVLRPVDFPFIERWPEIVNRITPGESLVLSVRYYEDEIVRRAPWAIKQDHWYYLVDSPIQLHLLWSATPSRYRYLDLARTEPLVRHSFHVIATPPSWEILRVDLKPNWWMGASLVDNLSEKSGRVSWTAFLSQGDFPRRLMNTTEILREFGQERGNDAG